MTKARKIVEARAIVKDFARLESRLSKLLTAKEMKELESALDLVKTAARILEAKLLTIDPAFKEKLDRYLSNSTGK